MKSSKMNYTMDNFAWNLLTFIGGLVFLWAVALMVCVFWTVVMAGFACYAIPVFLYERTSRLVAKWTT